MDRIAILLFGLTLLAGWEALTKLQAAARCRKMGFTRGALNNTNDAHLWLLTAVIALVSTIGMALSRSA